jgi:hypothetical protein
VRGFAREAMYHPPRKWRTRGQRSDGPGLRLVSGGALGLGRAASDASRSWWLWGVLWMGVRMGTGDASLGGAWDACGALGGVLRGLPSGASYEDARASGSSGKIARGGHRLRRRTAALLAHGNDAFSSQDTTCRGRFRRSERAFTGRQNQLSEQEAVHSPRAGRRARRRRRAVQTTPGSRLPRRDRRRRPHERVRR